MQNPHSMFGNQNNGEFNCYDMVHNGSMRRICIITLCGTSAGDVLPAQSRDSHLLIASWDMEVEGKRDSHSATLFLYYSASISLSYSVCLSLPLSLLLCLRPSLSLSPLALSLALSPPFSVCLSYCLSICLSLLSLSCKLWELSGKWFDWYQWLDMGRVLLVGIRVKKRVQVGYC